MSIDSRPVRAVDYATLSAGYGALLGALLVASRDKGEEPVRPEEALSLGVATFALAKLVAKEKVEGWVREPFVHEESEVRAPKGTGLRYAIGELLTCTRCTGVWSALGLVALRVTRPREARVVTTLLGASAVNDFAQSAFTWAQAHTDAAQLRTSREQRFERGEAEAAVR
ncbi:MAG TPA: DUF1360 domain-containing protein [Solirubrobacteraceae bacterium]|nr:DUF1360 domain-containing protein [Solirubrobacteraceae bacterium]